MGFLMISEYQTPSPVHPSIICVSVTHHYTTLTNFSTKYLVMCNIYTDVGGIK